MTLTKYALLLKEISITSKITSALQDVAHKMKKRFMLTESLLALPNS